MRNTHGPVIMLWGDNTPKLPKRVATPIKVSKNKFYMPDKKTQVKR